MALNNLGLGFVFTARDLASSKLAGLERRFASLDDRVTGGTARMTSAFRQLGLGLAVFTAGAGAAFGALSLANAAAPFEQGLDAVGAVTRATTRELDLLRDAAIQAGIQTQFSPEEAVAGLQSLATAGQTATQATRTLVPVLDLAAGSLGQLGVANAAEAVVGTLNAYGMAASDATGVTDRLLRITQLTNFQTRDFETGLSKAAATGAVFGQQLDDVLITMGLLRNRNIDASSSATAFRESVRRVGAESRAQQAITGAGVAIFDKQSGKMRSIVDIMDDFATATASMSEAERNRRVATAFGARGLLAFNAVLNASFTTLRDGRQVTLQGADAIAALREQMGAAEGTAAQFRAQLLDNFAGQKTLLAGTLQTFAVVLGEPFAAVFKPIVGAVVDGLNALLRAFQAIPAPVKRAFAGLVVAASGFLMLVGGVIAAKGAIALLGIAVQVLGISLGGILVTLLPAVLAVLALGAVIAGFAIAFERNLGGIADIARRVGAQIALVFDGLAQLFAQGGFSGAVRAELGRAENQGLKRFLIALYQIGYRLQRVWEGFQAGFTAAIEQARPVFEDLVDAFHVLGGELAALFADLSGSATGLPSSEFLDFGQVVGSALASVVRWFARLLAIATRVAGGVVGGVRAMTDYLGPAFDVVGEALGTLRDAWDALTGSTDAAGSTADASTSGWRSLGMFLGQTLGGILTAITLAFAGLLDVLAVVVDVVRLVKDRFVATGTRIGETAAWLVLWFTDRLPAAIASAVATVTGFFDRVGAYLAGAGARFVALFGAIADGIRGFLAPVVAFFEGVGRTIERVFRDIYDVVIQLLREIPDELLPERLERLKRTPLTAELRTVAEVDAGERTVATAARAEAASAAMPAVSATASRARELGTLEASLRALVGAQAGASEQPPVQIHVQVDGETIARATHNANRDAAARAFAPLPTY
ncbi:phage tail tape measure protein [Haliangium ochraceum]|uniref:Phage tail tape measure protein, TP901 family n=1 Tax=Haliangium ochraceum (strain DSM 14365 / JCM 11303 / SMP-2) TaxID=502025 RepID=D0LP98_HALO1|nr:phage tail tape measure protein [Haliangium ochraceum]ACY13463.1 phage tail tape measure protein, TP901 family [Haliangium ochraceum DSM 14365]